MDLSSLPHPTLNADQSCYEYNGKQLDRVTQIVHEVCPPYLAPWAEKVGREAALKLYQQYGSLPSSPEELKSQVIAHGFTTDDEKKAGGLRGAELHFALEAYIKQGLPPTLSDFEPEVRPYAQSLCQFLIDYEPEFQVSELTVFNPQFGYAGTIDAIGKVTKRPKGARHVDITGQTRIFDLKTNKDKSVYEQHYVQLAAYELALLEWDVSVDGAVVVAVGPWKEKGKPYRVAPSFWEARDFVDVVNLFRTKQAAKLRNPNRKRKDG